MEEYSSLAYSNDHTSFISKCLICQFDFINSEDDTDQTCVEILDIGAHDWSGLFSKLNRPPKQDIYIQNTSLNPSSLKQMTSRLKLQLNTSLTRKLTNKKYLFHKPRSIFRGRYTHTIFDHGLFRQSSFPSYKTRLPISHGIVELFLPMMMIFNVSALSTVIIMSSVDFYHVCDVTMFITNATYLLPRTSVSEYKGRSFPFPRVKLITVEVRLKISNCT